ncbi:DNA-directed RNA polymerase subunit delta [Alicyclobacillus tolerans]|uniref:DNA-directed RNA polymerase subunit delta n=1 Tax=Alicyclobacillus tolerans TaxID=90970 RepID=UPI001EFF6BE7|nr:DNA-directed RNA polymerase subunit delta [Alicyclobacillus tolerans]MCF8565628.1 DNA-directed RNA polymerase subunit delta [Alicyclobacillus tolerans]
MAVSLGKSQEEVQQLPLVELAWEILKARKEPFYFRDLMNEIQALRGMTEEEAMDVIARLYTEINIDGRFICIGQNVWGLKRWYPVDKTADKASSKRFVRASGDAFSDDDEDIDEDFDEDDLTVDDDDDTTLFKSTDDDEDIDEEASEDEDFTEEEDADFADEEEEGAIEEDLDESESDDESEDDEEY